MLIITPWHFSRNAWLYPSYKWMDTWIVSSPIESGASLTAHYKRQVSGAGFTGCMPLAGIKHGLFILAGEMEWMCAAASWETRH